jgi:hypothetical protein
MYVTLVPLDRNHANLCVGLFRTGISVLCCWNIREHLVLLFQYYVRFSQIILLWCEKTSTLSCSDTQRKGNYMIWITHFIQGCTVPWGHAWWWQIYVFLMFMGLCIVIIFWYINPNKMHMSQSLFLSENCSTYFGFHYHPSSGAQNNSN